MDGVVLPIAILLLAGLLRSVRLLILPLLCIATSSMVTFSLMYAITFVFDIVCTLHLFSFFSATCFWFKLAGFCF